MASSHRAAVTIVCAHVAFWVNGLESDTVRYITIVKGVVTVSYSARNWPQYIHDVSIVIKQIKSQHFFAHRQNCHDISSMTTAARCEPVISYIEC